MTQYAHLCVKVPIAAHSFVASPSEALAMVERVLKFNGSSQDCEVTMDGRYGFSNLMNDVRALPSEEQTTTNVFENNQDSPLTG